MPLLVIIQQHKMNLLPYMHTCCLARRGPTLHNSSGFAPTNHSSPTEQINITSGVARRMHTWNWAVVTSIHTVGQDLASVHTTGKHQTSEGLRPLIKHIIYMHIHIVLPRMARHYRRIIHHLIAFSHSSGLHRNDLLIALKWIAKLMTVLIWTWACSKSMTSTAAVVPGFPSVHESIVIDMIF